MLLWATNSTTNNNFAYHFCLLLLLSYKLKLFQNLMVEENQKTKLLGCCIDTEWRHSPANRVHDVENWFSLFVVAFRACIINIRLVCEYKSKLKTCSLQAPVYFGLTFWRLRWTSSWFSLRIFFGRKRGRRMSLTYKNMCE